MLLAAPCASRAHDEIKTYTVPKERTTADDVVAQLPGKIAATPTSEIPVNPDHDHVTWTTPSTWQELVPTSIRIGNFALHGRNGAKGEAAIYCFPGSVGTELENVNRWRNELKLPPLDSDKIASEPVTIDSLPGKLYEISASSSRTVVASLPRNGSTWFIKMRGDKDVVSDAEPVFRDFLKSIHFTSGMAEATPASAPDAIAPAESAGAEPKWSVPANWAEKAPGPMILKSYAVADNAGKMVSVTISSFAGDVGGNFANVNRWRAQVSLPPIEDDQLDSVTQPLDTTAGKAIMVDFTGTDSKTGEPARLVAVIVPHGDGTWFYKLLGDGSVVAGQKESFLKFVQNVHYP